MNRGDIMTISMHLVTETCFTCGVPFAMAENFRDQRLEKKDTWYCPAGHAQHYTGETEADRLKRLNESLQRRIASRDEDLRIERMMHRNTKGQLTKTKKRIANGVCPCCQRSFVNVARHMANQHPNYETAPSIA